MSQLDNPAWAQPGDQNVMGLDMREEDLSEFLDFSQFSTYNALDGREHSSTQPFGDTLTLRDGRNDSVDNALRYFNDPTTSITGTGQNTDFPSVSTRPEEFQKAQSWSEGFVNLGRRALPTPNSSEIYGKPGESSLYQYQQHAPQHGGHQRRIPASGINIAPYTPFASPGLDGSQSAVSYVPEYTVPGSYGLSPLGSPAINPQISQNHTSLSYPRIGDSLIAQSTPVKTIAPKGDADRSQEDRPRKARKRTAPATRSTTASARKGKGATGPHSRKNSASLKLATRAGNDMNDAGPQSAKEPLDRSDTASANATSSRSTSSISPFPRNEALMAPPPTPGQSSATVATHPPRGAQRLGPGPTSNPATPTSMMLRRTKASQTASNTGLNGSPRDQATTAVDSPMEFLQLPEAATSAPTVGSQSMSHGSGRSSMTEQSKPSIDSGKSGTTSLPASATTSPAGPAGMSKGDSKGGGDASRKTGSTPNHRISPSVRPKISPAVKPLLPEGSGMDSQTHALLLASRSNYENIVSGHHLPGVSYDSDLRNSLTSKRTSHKLAEQGRRNRINDALKEMQTLLPADFAAAVKESENAQKGAAGNGNSKAATVENAIDYIKYLQCELEKREDVIRGLQGDEGTSREGG